VWIESEGRAKTNEFVLSRTDISTIVAYRRPMDTMRHDTYLQDTEVALIREFRSPASTRDGFIREVPGGSSFKVGQDPAKVMAEELDEETGLTVEDHSRFKAIGSRQTVGTFSAHKAHAYSIRLTDWEMGYLKQQQAENAVHGNEGDSERTYVEVHRVNDLLDDPSVDWSMMGMILTALLTEPLE
jgi:8-oxo-dGTP pyrophosphatase MutT (NUDIX family)